MPHPSSTLSRTRGRVTLKSQDKQPYLPGPSSLRVPSHGMLQPAGARQRWATDVGWASTTGTEFVAAILGQSSGLPFRRYPSPRAPLRVNRDSLTLGAPL